ncbi:MAG: DUF4878 domain-containing protein [Bacillota bacterium]|nr:DUF4878 domain-containing protein [Bacillota bacterium]
MRTTAASHITERKVGMMKRIFSIIVSVTMCVAGLMALTGCGEVSPTDTVKTFLDAVKAKDEKAALTVYAEKEVDFFNGLFEENSGKDETEEDSIWGESFQKIMAEKLSDFDYEIVGEKIKGDKAKVTVKVTTYPMGSTLTQIYTDMVEKAWSLMDDEASDEEINAALKKVFQDKWEGMTEKTYSHKTNITLTKTDDGWKVDKINKYGKVANVLTGGLMNTVKAINEEWDF